MLDRRAFLTTATAGAAITAAGFPAAQAATAPTADSQHTMALDLTALDAAIARHPFPGGLLMSKKSRNRLTRYARAPGMPAMIRWEIDNYGERIAYFSDLPIIAVDYDDINTRLLDNGEVHVVGRHMADHFRAYEQEHLSHDGMAAKMAAKVDMLERRAQMVRAIQDLSGSGLVPYTSMRFAA